MLKIRMQRTGRINIPSYRIVVVERARSAKTGSFVERLGSYNPKTKERILNAERVKYWMSVGAQPSATVHNMLVSSGILSGKKINVLPAYKAPAEATAQAEAEVSAKAAEQETKAQAKAAHDAEVAAEVEAKEAEAPAEAPAPSEAPAAEAPEAKTE